MKAIILAGGYGTRLSEETINKPKPMVEVGGRPILWHIMKIFSTHGINEFIICLGYKGYMIKEYFANYFLHQSDVSIDLVTNTLTVLEKRSEPWRVTLVDTGINSMTGGRLRRVSRFVKDDDAFCMTYGDGVSDVDIRRLIAFHKAHGAKATLTGALPPGRFGALSLDGDRVVAFEEKPKGDGALINAGFFVLSPKIFQYIDGDHTVWEQEPLKNLATDDELRVYKHDGFWQPMDTLRDMRVLERLWEENKAPWKTWEQ